MDTNKTLSEINKLYSEAPEAVSPAFIESIEEAERENDMRALLVLCNEAMGHFREAGEHEYSIECGKKALRAVEALNLTDTVEYGTTLVNIGTAARAAGLYDAAKTYYDTALSVYSGKIKENDFLYASLYNNYSLCLQMTSEYERSLEYLNKALEIIKNDESKRVEIATTYSNIAVSEINLDRLDDAMAHLKKSFKLFEADEKPDYHYSAALCAMAQALYLNGDYDGSAAYYEKALKQVESVMGRSENYEIILSNLNAVNQIRNMLPEVLSGFENGLELCREYYEEIGARMIHESFPEYESQIAVGLVGEGSECFGFDDEFSRDHDFGPGFQMFLTDSVYDEIGERLQEEYDRLPKTYKGFTRINTSKAGKRVGVFKIGGFYEHFLGIRDVPVSNNEWLFIDDYSFRTATNGEVFRDDLGEFTRIRKGILNYYPDEVRNKKLAREAAIIAQSGQYNYLRMLKRGDIVTAKISLSEFISHTMSMIYLLNREYAPFYKWMYRGLKELPILNNVRSLLVWLAGNSVDDSANIDIIERIVAMIIAEMKKQGLTKKDDNFLDAHTDSIILSLEGPTSDGAGLHNAPAASGTDNTFFSIKDELIKSLVSLEWASFDKTENEGGRASCQDDFFTFDIMRRSQYMTWDEEMLKSYIHDFKTANDNGWNLITEKYGRMEESTAPSKWNAIKDKFPFISDEKRAIIEEIVSIQVKWMEELAAKYPKSADNARSIHTYEDSEYNTSYETYLRGEISTYSDKTLELYGRFIVSLAKADKNLAMMTMDNTARLYGYKSLDDLEGKL